MPARASHLLWKADTAQLIPSTTSAVVLGTLLQLFSSATWGKLGSDTVEVDTRAKHTLTGTMVACLAMTKAVPAMSEATAVFVLIKKVTPRGRTHPMERIYKITHRTSGNDKSVFDPASELGLCSSNTTVDDIDLNPVSSYRKVQSSNVDLCGNSSRPFSSLPMVVNAPGCDIRVKALLIIKIARGPRGQKLPEGRAKEEVAEEGAFTTPDDAERDAEAEIEGDIADAEDIDGDVPDAEGVDDIPDAESGEDIPDTEDADKIPDAEGADEIPNTEGAEDNPGAETTEDILDPEGADEIADAEGGADEIPEGADDIPDTEDADDIPDAEGGRDTLDAETKVALPDMRETDIPDTELMLDADGPEDIAVGGAETDNADEECGEGAAEAGRDVKIADDGTEDILEGGSEETGLDMPWQRLWGQPRMEVLVWKSKSTSQEEASRQSILLGFFGRQNIDRVYLKRKLPFTMGRSGSRLNKKRE
ncbi:hypothetical protein B0H10DRAFT_1946216 [Mycena sp. CBHHK59/15]|nr:hypothetical protein B0H10DRAFT_1946216 [Mycena sp. CBHHK59/15]